MTKPLISIIMPAYNAERYIAESIGSVLSQTYQNWELIIVDDGSTDKTADVVLNRSSSDSRIKYIFEENKGVAAARNTGIKRSSGDLIAFLDSDDLWLEEKLELQVRIMEEVNADVVFSSGFMFDEEDTANETVTYPTFLGKFDPPDMFKLLLVEVANRIPALSVLMRRDVLCRTKLFDESAALYYGSEDYDLWLSLAKHGAVFYGMTEKLVRYRVRANSLSRNKAEMMKAMVAVVEKHQHDPSLNRIERKRMYGIAYRALTSAFVAENRVAEAKASMKELVARDGFGLKTLVFRALMKISPNAFDAINRRRLNILGKFASN